MIEISDEDDEGEAEWEEEETVKMNHEIRYLLVLYIQCPILLYKCW